MAATVSVRFDFGGVDGNAATNQDVDSLGPPSLRFKLADNATIDTLNPLVIPAAGAGPYRSCWKHIYLYCDDADGKTLSNIKLYSDGANSYGTGVSLKVGLQFPARTAGVGEANYEVCDAGHGLGTNTIDELAAGHGGITSTADIFTYTAASPLSVTITEVGNVINAATETSDYILLQMEVANTASAGTTTAETFYLAYDST